MSAKKRVKIWLLPGLLIAILLLALKPEVANAQSAAEAMRELMRTDEVLLKAKRLVIDENCPSQRAREFLIQARDLQKEAWRAYGKGMHRTAMKGTRAARELAGEAIKIAERWRFVKDQIHKTAELLELASEKVTTSQNPQTAGLLETALRQFERGKSALREGQVEQAFHLLKNANKLVRDIIAMLQEEQGDQIRVGRELARTDRLIEKARPLIEESGDEQALILSDRGLQNQTKAQGFFDQGRYQVAYQLTLEARELVARALVMVEGPISPERVGQAIAATDELMARVRPMITESQNDAAIDLFLTADNHQDKAKEALAGGRLKVALAQTKVARRLVDKALELVGEP
jgi:hypothetical protein